MGHSHHHGHGHGHPHGHVCAHDREHDESEPHRRRTASSKNRRRLTISLVLTIAYMIAEVVGGVATNSLALFADAGHMLSDAAALALSLFAIWIADRGPSAKRTYGWYRIEILAALANGAALIAIAVLIVVEAIDRFNTPHDVRGPWMLAIAAGGLTVNIIGIVILSGGRHDSLNMRGAWLHVLTDALGSIGAMISGACIWAFGWRIADPIASLVISALVMYSAWPLVEQAVGILMESAPGHIDVDAVRDAMARVDGVREVHDLHVWCITQGLECLSGHVVAETGRDHQELLATLRKGLHDRFGIDHITIQIELDGLEERHVCS